MRAWSHTGEGVAPMQPKTLSPSPSPRAEQVHHTSRRQTVSLERKKDILDLGLGKIHMDLYFGIVRGLIILTWMIFPESWLVKWLAHLSCTITVKRLQILCNSWSQQ